MAEVLLSNMTADDATKQVSEQTKTGETKISKSDSINEDLVKLNIIQVLYYVFPECSHKSGFKITAKDLETIKAKALAMGLEWDQFEALGTSDKEIMITETIFSFALTYLSYHYGYNFEYCKGLFGIFDIADHRELYEDAKSIITFDKNNSSFYFTATDDYVKEYRNYKVGIYAKGKPKAYINLEINPNDSDNDQEVEGEVMIKFPVTYDVVSKKLKS